MKTDKLKSHSERLELYKDLDLDAKCIEVEVPEIGEGLSIFAHPLSARDVAILKDDFYSQGNDVKLWGIVIKSYRESDSINSDLVFCKDDIDDLIRFGGVFGKKLRAPAIQLSGLSEAWVTMQDEHLMNDEDYDLKFDIASELGMSLVDVDKLSYREIVQWKLRFNRVPPMAKMLARVFHTYGHTQSNKEEIHDAYNLDRTNSYIDRLTKEALTSSNNVPDEENIKMQADAMNAIAKAYGKPSKRQRI